MFSVVDDYSLINKYKIYITEQICFCINTKKCYMLVVNYRRFETDIVSADRFKETSLLRKKKKKSVSYR